MAQRTPRGRTKAATTTARRIPYQLWIDRKLQRISLKRVAPATKARKAARATRVRHSARAFTSRTSVLAAMVVLAGAVIIAARGGSRQVESAATAAPPPALALTQDLALPAERATRPTVEASVLQTAGGPNPGRAGMALTTVPAALKTPAANPTPVAEEETPAAAAETVSLTAAPAPTPEAQLTAPAALAGCLVFDDGTYRLKGASGVDAPRSRSWKSGFLRKRTADIDVIDAGHSLSLAAHVGQRIEVTGTLLDREMRARSVQRLADTCKP